MTDPVDPQDPKRRKTDADGDGEDIPIVIMPEGSDDTEEAPDPYAEAAEQLARGEPAPAPSPSLARDVPMSPAVDRESFKQPVAPRPKTPAKAKQKVALKAGAKLELKRGETSAQAENAQAEGDASATASPPVASPSAPPAAAPPAAAPPTAVPRARGAQPTTPQRRAPQSSGSLSTNQAAARAASSDESAPVVPPGSATSPQTHRPPASPPPTHGTQPTSRRDQPLPPPGSPPPSSPESQGFVQKPLAQPQVPAPPPPSQAQPASPVQPSQAPPQTAATPPPPTLQSGVGTAGAAPPATPYTDQPAPGAQPQPAPGAMPAGFQPAGPVTPEHEKHLEEARILQFVESDIDREIDEQLEREDDERSKFRLSKLLFNFICLVTFLAVPIPFVLGYEYYQLPLTERIFHKYHHLLRPSGVFGLGMGVLGTFVMLASMIYLLRKYQYRGFQWGSVKGWLNFHILFGLLGPFMVLYHSSFKPVSALGILSMGSMMIVVVSGIAGRYLMTLFPSGLDGTEGIEEIKKRLTVYKKKLVSMGIKPELLADTSLEGEEKKKRFQLFGGLFHLLRGDKRSREEFRRIRQAVRSTGSAAQASRVLILARRMVRERQVLIRYHALRRVIGTWRFLHRWLAVTMFAGVFFHIMLALRFASLLGKS